MCWPQLFRYEVPYSEHCNFEELRTFVDFVDPSIIIPSVHNDSEADAERLVTMLSSNNNL